MRFRSSSLILAIFIASIPVSVLGAQTENTETRSGEFGTRLFFSPRTYQVLTDSEFEASIYLDTRGSAIDFVDVEVSFPADLVSVVTPSSGKSLIESWTNPPTYSNRRGTLQFSGGMAHGIKTDSGLVTKITFRAKSAGTGSITIKKTSQVLLSDGLGTKTEIEALPLTVVVEPRAPDGVVVMSATHPVQGNWSNNNSPSFYWEKQEGDEGYSFLFDDKPYTVPPNTITSSDTQIGYEDIKDGVWYFHLKSKNKGIWSVPTHYLVRIDTTPPASFVPVVKQNTLSQKLISVISFFSADSLSGVDHYEIGILKASAESDTLPGFIQTESPFYLPAENYSDALVTIRALDQAGNIRDETIPARPVPSLLGHLRENTPYLVLGLAALLFIFGLIIVVAGRRRRGQITMKTEDMQKLINYASSHANYIPPVEKMGIALSVQPAPEVLFPVIKNK